MKVRIQYAPRVSDGHDQLTGMPRQKTLPPRIVDIELEPKWLPNTDDVLWFTLDGKKIYGKVVSRAYDTVAHPPQVTLYLR